MIAQRILFLAVILFLAACNGKIEQNQPSKSWGTTTRLDTGDGSAESPQVGVDGAGNAIAVWRQSSGSKYTIRAAFYSAATDRWATPADVQQTNWNGDAYYPQVKMDKTGNAMVVWLQYDQSRGYTVRSRRYNVYSGSWGTETELGTDADADSHQVAVDKNGNAIVIFARSDGEVFSIWARRYNGATDSWEPATLLETDNSGNARTPHIGMDGEGDAIAVWTQNSSGSHIWANRYDASTNSWGTATMIHGIDDRANGNPQVAMDGSGNAVAVWHQKSGDMSTNVWANSFDSATRSWDNAMLIQANPQEHGFLPEVAVDASGNAICVWTQDVLLMAMTPAVWANRYNASRKEWEVAIFLAGGDNANNAVNPVIAIDETGNGIAAWKQYSGNGDQIWVKLYNKAMGSWGPCTAMSNSSDSRAYTQRVAMYGVGNAVMVWQQGQQEAGSCHIYGNRYR